MANLRSSRSVIARTLQFQTLDARIPLAAEVLLPEVAQDFGRPAAGVSSQSQSTDPVAANSSLNPITASASASSPAVYALQQASIADRDIQSVGFDEFHEATALPATSPQLQDAIPGDVVINQSGFIGEDVTAVVL